MNRLLLAGILLLALVLRLVGLGFGLPELYHWDEQIDAYLAFEALQKGYRLSIPDHGTLFIFALLGVTWLAHGAGQLTGSIALGYEAAYHANPATFLIPARAFVAVLGALTVLPVFLSARRLYGTQIGLVAALFLAVAPLHVTESHYARNHVPAALLSALALWGGATALVAGTGLLRAGLFAGLATATAYHAVAIVPALALVVALRARAESSGLLDLARGATSPLLRLGAGVALGLAVGLPQAWTDPRGFYRALRYFRSQSALSVADVDVPGWWFYLTEHLREGVGDWIWTLALFGAAWAALRRLPPDLWLLGYAGLFVLGLEVALGDTPSFARYLLPVLPAVAILAARFAVEAWSQLRGRLSTVARASEPSARRGGAARAPDPRLRSGRDEGPAPLQPWPLVRRAGTTSQSLAGSSPGGDLPRAGAGGGGESVARPTRGLPIRARRAVGWSLLLAAVVPSLLTDVGYLRLLHLPDTRPEARRWLEAELPEGTRIVVEGASAFERFAIVGPQIGMTRAQLEDRIGNEPDAVMARWQRNLVAHRPSSRHFELLLVPRLDTVIVDGQIRELPDVSFYRQRDVPYLVASSWAVRDARTGYSDAFVASLAQSYEPVQEWRPSRPLRWDPFAWRLDYPAIRALVFAHPSHTVGPTLTLYRARSAP